MDDVMRVFCMADWSSGTGVGKGFDMVWYDSVGMHFGSEIKRVERGSILVIASLLWLARHAGKVRAFNAEGLS